uniref:Galectin n=1 Tax=Caenorhabditis japonica TaxID=281687 RepID=A0A8R1HYX2_CAEJA
MRVWIALCLVQALSVVFVVAEVSLRFKHLVSLTEFEYIDTGDSKSKSNSSFTNGTEGIDSLSSNATTQSPSGSGNNTNSGEGTGPGSSGNNTGSGESTGPGSSGNNTDSGVTPISGSTDNSTLPDDTDGSGTPDDSNDSTNTTDSTIDYTDFENNTLSTDSNETYVLTTTEAGLNNSNADCYLCVATVQCGETIHGDFSNPEVNVLFMKEMEDGDTLIVKGLVLPNAEKIYFDVFKDLSVGKVQVGGRPQSALVQFEHYYETNLTFSRSGSKEKDEWDSFRPATLPQSIREKKPWTLMFKMHREQTGFETGDENGFFNNHIPWTGPATTQSFNIRGDWQTTSVTFKCANS